jgi:4-oxalocrotonate tautomerase
MPCINMKITPDGATPAQKPQSIAQFTDTLIRALDKKSGHARIVVDEITHPPNRGYA